MRAPRSNTRQGRTNVNRLTPSLGAILGVLAGSALLTAIAAAQPLPPPPTATAPPSVAVVPPAKHPAAKPKPKPKAPLAAKKKPAVPLALDRNPPRPPADIAPPVTSAPPAPLPPPAAQTVPLPPSASKFDARQRTIIERVSSYLSNLRTVVGEFKQVAPDGSRTEGDFYLLKPGRVRFDYNAPSPVELIADGKSVAVRDRILASQDLYPISQTPLRFLLADHIDLLRDTNLVAVYGDNIFVTVVIEEKQIVRGSYRVMLMFDAQNMQLKQWVVTDPQGMDTTVVVFNLDTKSTPDPGMFKIDYTRYVR
jgi:outer membrane lipoprotein-sorting protein